jgi:hypothetical protein
MYGVQVIHLGLGVFRGCLEIDGTSRLDIRALYIIYRKVNNIQCLYDIYATRG